MDFKKIILSILFSLSMSTLAYSNSISEVNTNNLLSMIANSKGQVVLVSFWASWCPYCVKEIKELKTLRDKYNQNELKIIGVSFDLSKSHLIQILKKSKINYPNYISADNSIGMVFGVMGVPATILYDKNGKIVKQFQGYVNCEEIDKIIQKLLKSD